MVVSLAILKRIKKGESISSIKRETCLTHSHVILPYYNSEHPDVEDYREKKKLKRFKCAAMTVEERDDIDIAIMERVKKGRTFTEIAIAMSLENVTNLFHGSQQPDVEDYREKKKLKRVQLKANKELEERQKKEESRK